MRRQPPGEAIRNKPPEQIERMVAALVQAAEERRRHKGRRRTRAPIAETHKGAKP